jgi:hypothetical protein
MGMIFALPFPDLMLDNPSGEIVLMLNMGINGSLSQRSKVISR